jgi:hypothetical protein
MSDATTTGLAHALWHGSTNGVAVLRWPTQQTEREHLDWLGLPRLLLVEPGDPPPDCVSCLEDWTRLPAPDEDVCARISALRARANRHPPTPKVDQWGRLSYREHHTYLSPGEHAIAQPLTETFCAPVPEALLLERLFPQDTGTAEKLRVHVHRLRRRIQHMALHITNLRAFGYMMTDDANTPHPYN